MVMKKLKRKVTMIKVGAPLKGCATDHFATKDFT
jgi:hypothetical protein